MEVNFKLGFENKSAVVDGSIYFKLDGIVFYIMLQAFIESDVIPKVGSKISLHFIPFFLVCLFALNFNIIVPY